jgi:hypothetical protein
MSTDLPATWPRPNWAKCLINGGKVQLSPRLRWSEGAKMVGLGHFLHICEQSGLLNGEQLKVACTILHLESPHTETKNHAAVEVLGAHLIDNQLLTNWQFEKLRDGRWKGFFLGPYKLLAHVTCDDIHSIYLAEDVNSHHRDHLAILAPPKSGPAPVGYLEANGVYFRIVDVNVGGE